MRYIVVAIVMAGMAGSVVAGESSTSATRLANAAAVLKEVMDTPDKAIPQGLLDKAHAVVIVPGLKKGAFMIGAKYGKGYISFRKKEGPGWTAPGTVRVEGGSIGFQFGGSESDVVMLVMNERGAQRLLASKFTLGADVSVAAGPVGRDARAETDAMLTAEMLSWSRQRGVFAGVSLSGATLREDLKDNRELYGQTLQNHEIMEKDLPVPEAAKGLIALLDQYSPERKN
jgi:lipid-binding SYLF domain-containing protein